MQTYQYSAISKDGAKVSGVIEAFDEFAAVASIKETCSVVTKIQAVEQKGLLTRDVFTPKIKERDLAVMCSQFAIILGAGLPMVRAVELIASQTEDRRLKELLNQVAGDVAGGVSLAHSFETRSSVLPVTFVETVRAGETSGTLDSSFQRLHAYYDRASKLKGKVQAAMAYPIFTMIVAVIVVAIIMVKAVPTFVTSFSEMGTALPWPTQILIATSNFCSAWWPVMAAVLIGIILAWKLWGHSEDGQIKQHRWLLRIPVMGKLSLMRTASQFAGTTAALLAAGLPVLNAMDIVARVLDNRAMGRDLSLQLPRLEEGKPLAACLRDCPDFPDLLVEMTGVGEETGTLEHTLDVVSDYYDNETQLRAQKAVSLLEPAIICVLAVIVVVILLAVYLPMFSMYGSIM